MTAASAIRCAYVYCREPLPSGAEECALCGFPVDPAQLRDPAFLAAEGDSRLEGLPKTILDLHQIVPAVPGVEQAQQMAMERFGVEAALLQSAPPQAASLYGNEELRRLAGEHPGRFWISQFTDPRHPQALDHLRAFAAGGIQVVKLLPVAGYRPDSPDLEPFLALMEELGLVAMAHTGFITARHKAEEKKAGAYLSSTFSDPLYWDLPARKFPGLQIILCHTGGALGYEAAAQMVTQHDNVWGDLSGFGLFALRRILALGVTVDWTKLFWGNDSPPFAYPVNLRLLLAALRQAGAEALAPALLEANGRAFAQAHLGAPTGSQAGAGR